MKICPLDTRDQLPLAAVLPPWSGRYRTARAPRGYTRWGHTPNDLQEWAGFSATAYSGSSHKWGELNHSSVGKLVGRRCTGITSLHLNIKERYGTLGITLDALSRVSNQCYTRIGILKKCAVYELVAELNFRACRSHRRAVYRQRGR